MFLLFILLLKSLQTSASVVWLKHQHMCVKKYMTGCDRHVILAHIAKPDERQTVQEHCRNTAALAAAALRPLGLEKCAYLAGLLHDAGKNKQEYAQYLSEAVSGGNAVRGSVNHTFAGVRLLLDRWHGGCVRSPIPT